MKLRNDLTGRRFGKLLVVRQATPEERAQAAAQRGGYYFCQCDCGGTKIVRGNNLMQGYTKSCGCWNRNDTVKNAETDQAAKLSKFQKYEIVKKALCAKHERKCFTSPLGKCPLAKYDCYYYATISQLYNAIGVGGRKPLIDAIKKAAKDNNVDVKL